jgi:hypothetical protein
LYNKAKTTLVAYPSAKDSIIIPNGVTTIGRGAFGGCASLTGINIPNGVTSIGNNAFAACTSLASITIPNSVTTIDNYAFTSCTSLISVTFATGSNITDTNFGVNAFPQGSNGSGGNTLKNAYNTEKAGTYTRQEGGDTWTKE